MTSLLRFISVCLALTFVAACTTPAVKPKKVTAKVDSSMVVIPSEAGPQYQQAVQMLASGNLKDSEAQLLVLTTRYPNLSGPYANLGLLYAQKKQWMQSERYLKLAIDKNPKNVKAMNVLANNFRQQGKFDQAKNWYLKAIAANPAFSDTFKNYGILLDVYMGEFKLAIQYYEQYQALQAKPDNQVAGWLVDINRRLAKEQQVAGGTQ